MGKERTRYNALKSGLFAKVVLLSHESQSQFDDLHHGLQDDLMPKGTLEEVLVEKLATNLWRYRRLLQVEIAGVQKNIEHQEEENSGFLPRPLPFRAFVDKITSQADRKGILSEIEDHPESLELCLDKLYAVRERADRYGIDYNFYFIDLGLIYGARYSGRPGKDLFDFYIECHSALEATAAEREKRGFASEEDCVQRFIAETEKEIRRLEGHRKRPIQEPKPSPLTDGVQPREIALLKWEIPDSGELDRLLRYEASLDRAFDRALIQFERLQRMREGQKTIEVAHQTTTSD